MASNTKEEVMFFLALAIAMAIGAFLVKFLNFKPTYLQVSWYEFFQKHPVIYILASFLGCLGLITVGRDIIEIMTNRPSYLFDGFKSYSFSFAITLSNVISMILLNKKNK